MQHLRQCKVQQPASNDENQVVDNLLDPDPPPVVEQFFWGEVRGSVIEADINHCYEKIVHWKKNLFLLPNGSTGKSYIREVTRLLNSWVDDSPLKVITMKAVHIMPALLLQKVSKTSKSHDHVLTLERRMKLWHKGDIRSLLDECETIQSRLPKIENNKRDINFISKKFKEHMEKGNVNSAMNLLTNNMSGGILPLNDETLKTLTEKHPDACEINEDVALQGPIKPINPIVFDGIDETMIMKAAKMTKGGAGPSSMDAEGWRKLLASRMYGDTGRDLRKSFANVIRKISTTEISDNSLEAFLACRLIPLDKCPGLRPIGVGEILRRISGKVVMFLSKADVMESASDVQMCSGVNAGCEAAVHAMKFMFEQEETEAVLLVDAANAFNNINRKVLLHNIQISCPMLAQICHQLLHHTDAAFRNRGWRTAIKRGYNAGRSIGNGNICH